MKKGKGKTIISARKKIGLSQRALAKQSGVSQKTISLIESNRTALLPETEAKLMKVLESKEPIKLEKEPIKLRPNPKKKLKSKPKSVSSSLPCKLSEDDAFEAKDRWVLVKNTVVKFFSVPLDETEEVSLQEMPLEKFLTEFEHSDAAKVKEKLFNRLKDSVH